MADLIVSKFNLNANVSSYSTYYVIFALFFFETTYKLNMGRPNRGRNMFGYEL